MCPVGGPGYNWATTPWWEFSTFWEMTEEEKAEIIRANNDLGWDFLTIARKVGVKDETS